MRRYLEVLSRAAQAQIYTNIRSSIDEPAEDVLVVVMTFHGKSHQYHFGQRIKRMFARSTLSEPSQRKLSDREVEALKLFVWEMRR